MSIVTRPSTKRRRRLWLALGLVALLLFVLFVVGGVIGLAWWQRPYQIEVWVCRSAADGHVIGEVTDEPQTNGPRNPYVREVRTMRRVLLEKSIKDGPAVDFDKEGNTLREENWSNNRLDGPFAQWARKDLPHGWPGEGPIIIIDRPLIETSNGGEVTLKGQYARGDMVGKWVCLRYDGALLAEQQFQLGRLFGTAINYDGKGNKLHGIEFVANAAVHEDFYEQPGGGLGYYLIRNRMDSDRPKQITWTADGSKKLGEFDPNTKTETDWFVDGSLRCRGRFNDDGDPTGAWVCRGQAGEPMRTLTMSRGWLVAIDGQPVSDRWRTTPKGLESGNEAHEFWTLMGEERLGGFSNTPLSAIVERMQDEHFSAFHIDRRAIAAAGKTDLPAITADFRPLSLNAALYLMLQPHGLNYTVRNEQIWITTTDKCRYPPESKRLPEVNSSGNASISAALKTRQDLSFAEMPIKEFAESLSAQHQIKVEVEPQLAERSRSDKRYAVTLKVSGVSLQAALETILEDLDLTCTCENDTLTIRIPQAK